MYDELITSIIHQLEAMTIEKLSDSAAFKLISLLPKKLEESFEDAVENGICDERLIKRITINGGFEAMVLNMDIHISIPMTDEQIEKLANSTAFAYRNMFICIVRAMSNEPKYLSSKVIEAIMNSSAIKGFQIKFE